MFGNVDTNREKIITIANALLLCFFIIYLPLVYMNVINNDKNVINNKPLSNRKLSDSCPSSFVELS